MNTDSSFDIELKERGVLGLMDSENLLRKTNEIRECHKLLTETRKMVSDKYAESIGNNASCITQ